jgi:tetratricopeptide (TPR) repeat protein
MNRSRGAIGAVIVLIVMAGCSPASRSVPATAPTPATHAAEPTAAPSPRDADALRAQGFELLQKIRDTGDPSLYAAADVAFQAANRLRPDDALTLVGIGGLQLGRHEFAKALETGREAVELAPNEASAHAVVVDALVELGRYDEADEAAGRMLGLSVDVGTLARVSYLHELKGDLDGALAAMRLAADSPAAAPENTAFALAHLGNLERWGGDEVAARTAYDRALAAVPNHGPSLAGLGRLAVGRGDLAEAIERFGRASDVIPLPEYVVALGDARRAAGDAEGARIAYATARAEIQLAESGGVVVDLDLALFEADHGDPAKALDLATTAYRAAPTVRAADALGWALHRLGREREASGYAREALRLGSIDPLFHYHAGAIAAAVGDARTARAELTKALATDPGFSATGAAEARPLLAALGG